MPAITYTLLVDGSPADADLLGAIREIEVEDHARMASILRLRASIGLDATGSRLSLLDDGLFSRLTNLQLHVTVGTGLPERLINAYVVETSAEFSNAPGGTVLNVVALDSTALMNLEEKTRAWPNMADSDVATAIFAEHDLIPDVEATEPSRNEEEVTLLQRGTDIRFLRQLAHRNGYECYVEANPLTGLMEGHFHPPRLDEEPQGVLTVNMGDATNVDRLGVRENLLQPTSAKITRIGALDLADEAGEAESPSLTDLGREGVTPTDHPRLTLLSHTGLSEASELQALAQSFVDRASWSIRAEGEVKTAAYGALLRAKRPVLVRGAGTTHSGAYYVERVLHSITPDSYAQRFTLLRNAHGLTGRENYLVGSALSV